MGVLQKTGQYTWGIVVGLASYGVSCAIDLLDYMKDNPHVLAEDALRHFESNFTLPPVLLMSLISVGCIGTFDYVYDKEDSLLGNAIKKARKGIDYLRHFGYTNTDIDIVNTV